MNDLPHERPEHNLYADFPTERYEHLINRFARNPRIRTALTTAQVIADFGSRLGNTALALSNVCPSATEIHTVDYDQRLDEEAAAQLSANKQLVTHNQTITEFLEQAVAAGLQLDIITIATVPEHLLDKHHGYSNLGRTISSGGVVFEFGDTNLDPQAMERVGFSLAAGERESDYGWLAHRAWQKS